MSTYQSSSFGQSNILEPHALIHPLDDPASKIAVGQGICRRQVKESGNVSSLCSDIVHYSQGSMDRLTETNAMYSTKSWGISLAASVQGLRTP